MTPREALDSTLAALYLREEERRKKVDALQEALVEAANLFTLGNTESSTLKLSEAADAEFELEGTTLAADDLAIKLGIYELYDSIDAERVTSHVCPTTAPPSSSNRH